MILSFYLFCLMNQGRTKGEGWSTHKVKAPPPSNFVAGRPKAALFFFFFFASFNDFRCGVLLFMVILVIYKYIKGKNNKC